MLAELGVVDLVGDPLAFVGVEERTQDRRVLRRELAPKCLDVALALAPGVYGPRGSSYEAPSASTFAAVPNLVSSSNEPRSVNVGAT